MWLDNMERYMTLHQAGLRMLAIPYSSWKLDARRTALSMLDYCGHCPDDLTGIEETLMKDSQAGSVVAQDALKGKSATSGLLDLAEMHHYLLNHAYLNTPDFEVAITLKL